MFFKVDVEGAETELLQSWLNRGTLQNVLQIGVEFHSVDHFFGEYFDILHQLYSKGFKLISWDANLLVKDQ